MSGSRPARWAINGRFLAQSQTGVQRYARELTQAIDAHLSTDETLARQIGFELLLPANAEDSLNLDAIPSRRSPRGTGYLWEQLVLPAMTRGGLISFANMGPLAHSRQIVCLHDANVFLEPTSYSTAFRLAYRALLPAVARCARAVTTVSAFSASMLGDFGVTGREAARVIPNGHEHALRWNGARSRFSAPDAFARPFVFALGSRAKHKRIDLLIELAPALDALGIDLVLSGGSSSIFAETEAMAARNVSHLGFVSDDDLAALLARALCFAFPSRTEGFGLPLLEAMVHGAPIVSSDRASMPGVCADAALYASPDDPAAWLACIRRYAEDDGLRADKRQLGYARAKEFSWTRSAELYLDLALKLSPQESRDAPMRRPMRQTAV